jgi:transposase
MKLKANVQFKPLTAHQAVLFPQSLDDRIAKDHAVRIVNSVVDKLNIDDILESYKGGGTSSFHPRMMLKVLFYSYFNNIYSCRKIAKALEENIHFMWLSGNSNPDYRTINEFRGKRLKDKIQILFSELVKLMQELGYVSLETQFVDGTKLESVANRYTFVWKKSIEKNKEKLEKKVQSILGDIDKTIESDKVESSSENTVKQVNKEELDRKIAELNTRMDELSKSEKKQVKELSKHAQKLGEYQQHLDKMEDRNSYSKTDPDATFMRMKEDHMKNGQLKPGYNAQISTENQIIVNYTLHQNPTDTKTLQPHLENLKETYGEEVFQELQDITADAGYGSEENYDYLEKQELIAYVKYNTFDKEQDKNYQKKHKPFSKENLHYNQEEDYYVCPMGQKMHKTHQSTKTTEAGHRQHLSHYQAQNCEGCPMRGQCFKGKGNRSIERNHNLERHKQKIRELLTSEIGLQKRKQRTADVEPVFAQLKHNHNFRRFSLKGIEKTELEFGLMAIAHNLRKKIAA